MVIQSLRNPAFADSSAVTTLEYKAQRIDALGAWRHI
jgi:hypothetical protein